MNPQHESEGSRTYLGHGADTDIIVASCKAFLSALNKMLLATRSERQKERVGA
jgi:2-isopropylmalate synthase